MKTFRRPTFKSRSAAYVGVAAIVLGYVIAGWFDSYLSKPIFFALVLFAIVMMMAAKSIRESDGIKTDIGHDKLGEFNRLAFLETIPALSAGLSGAAASFVIRNSYPIAIQRRVFAASIIMVVLSIVVNIYTFGRLKKLFER